MGIRKIISELLVLAERWKQLNFPLSKDGCETTRSYYRAQGTIFNILWYYISNKLKQAGRGPGHNLVKNDKAWGHHINWLETNGSKMAGQLTSSRPGASAYTHVNTSAGKMAQSQVPWQFQGQPWRSKSEQGPNSWNSPPLPPNSWNTPSTH